MSGYTQADFDRDSGADEDERVRRQGTPMQACSCVEVGQVWEDADPRVLSLYGARRFVVVLELKDNGKAQVRDRAYGRKTHVSIARLEEEQGWRFFATTEAEADALLARPRPGRNDQEGQTP